MILSLVHVSRQEFAECFNVWRTSQPLVFDLYITEISREITLTKHQAKHSDTLMVAEEPVFHILVYLYKQPITAC